MSPNKSANIILVEDDEPLGEAIKLVLKQYDYQVTWVTDGQTALDTILKKDFDIVILDLGLPKVPGLEVLSTMRKHEITTPVIILTALGSLQDRVKGLDAGADDYLIKPFDTDELIARLRALRRRSITQHECVIEYEGIVMDVDAHRVTFQGENVVLSRREFSLLQKLLENIGRVLSRDQLTQSLYGWDDEVDSNALEVHIHNLRKRFGTPLIRTVRGVGYMVEKEK